MKLIRLTSNDNNGLFDNTFNEDIIIDEKSQIALHSFTAEIDTQEIVIDAQNSEITFKLVGGNSSGTPARIVNLTHATYDSSNYGDLFTDATNKMNEKVNNVSTELGLQWQVQTNADKKVVFNILRGDYIAPENPTYVSKVGQTNIVYNSVGGGPTSWKRSGGVATNYDSFLYMKSPNCKGAGVFRARIAAEADSGFIVAYLASPPDASATEIALGDILYGIIVQSSNTTTANYKRIVNGQIYDNNSVFSAVGDNIAIETYNGFVHGTIYRNGEALLAPLFKIPYNHTDNLFPVLIMQGATAKADNVRFTSDPVYNRENILIPSTDPIVIEAMPNGGVSPTVKMLGFTDIDLARYFGFNNTVYTSPLQDNYAFESKYVFALADYCDSFVVELQNLNLDSYDGLSAQRRSILHTIVQADVIKQRLVYNSPYPLFLDLNNANKMTLRRIKARILREDLAATSMVGFGQITLIIKSSKE